MTKDQFRNIYFMFLVNNNWNSFTIIKDRDRSFFRINSDLKLRHFLISLVVIGSIYEDFIKNFVESWGVCNLSVRESDFSFGEYPLVFFWWFYSTNVGVWSEEYVFERSFLLIDFLNSFLFHCQKYIFDL